MECLDSGAIQVLLGVVLGGFITAGSTLFFELYKDARESRRLARALRGEIKALQTIIKKRQYIDLLRNIVATISSTQKPINIVIRVRRDYFKVYEANVERIGMLKNPLPEQIAAFYVKGNSIVEDLNALDDGLWHDKPAEYQIKFYSNLLDLFEETMRDADMIIETVDKKYS
mgnify:CR=1 FL=1